MSFLDKIKKQLIGLTTAIFSARQRGDGGRIIVEAMANLRSSSTGVDGTVIWISPGEFESNKSPCGPRIKVVLGNKITTEGLSGAVSVTLTKPPKVLGNLPPKVKKQATAFVRLNLEVLLAHWKGELASVEVLTKIKKVTQT